MLSTPHQIATTEGSKTLPEPEDYDYSFILQALELAYHPADYYWQVGEITKTQGWILHLSVVLSQVKDLIWNIIPILRKEMTPFKIVKTECIAEDILNGNFGLAKIGKIMSIYPDNDAAALALAKILIDSTKLYEGPNIPTDIRLGSVVYVRYGSFNPIIKIDADGNEEKCIYAVDGQLIKDPFAIPFQLPKGITWPFNELTVPNLPEPPKLLNRIYKLIEILKPDPRGNVFKGLYVKSVLQVKKCVIKQGFTGMSSDKAGRDIKDRLKWQYELYKELSGTVPLPAIYDLFEERNSTVLIMEFINGESLLDKLSNINPFSTSWQDLPVSECIHILAYAIEIVKIIGRMHCKGYVHRDIVPVNFLINKKGEITLIDVELAYSIKNNIPDPPFRLGTFGFMSPEQEAFQRPTIYEDIYGLGATLLYIFTGIFPVKFDTKDTKALADNLTFFTGNKEVAEMIANCMHRNPEVRPALPLLHQSLVKYQAQHKKNVSSSMLQPHSMQSLNRYMLAQTIETALNGLTQSPIIIQNNLWYSKHVNVENYTATKSRQYSVSPGLIEGICGPLYMLARIHRAGISVTSCSDAIGKGWKFLENNYFQRFPQISPGLYRGSAGFALTLAHSIRSGLMEDSEANRERIQNCLKKENEDINLANGIAGQGLSILQCSSFINNEDRNGLIEKIICKLLSRQQKDGSWLKSSNHYMNNGYDDNGILCFLLEYVSQYPDLNVKNAITKGLTRITTNNANMRHFYSLVASRESYEKGDGGTGLIFTFVKAYEILRVDNYRKIAEDALLKYPPRIVQNNITQENGLAAIGEIYLQAWRVFNNEEWKRRADWIANVFIHSLFKTETVTGHWVMEQNNPPTADFFIGNSGILHFLARCLVPDKIGYRLLE